ncbi:unnamed protein product [Phytophthora fragariaefolia]|uniref:Unnamed protein product n=1 Tax=Phytophthora fragariaefolia TaxID=1490495 RepID=A0A9W7CW87_9STRA|nr:unnamed protein product [Phytophthora fragariaefolia]
MSWSAGKSKRPAARKDRRSAKSAASMLAGSRATGVRVVATQLVPGVSEDAGGRAADAAASVFAFLPQQSKPTRRSASRGGGSSFSSPKLAKLDKFPGAEPVMFEFDGNFSRGSRPAFPPPSPSAASTASMTSSFSSQSFSTVDPLVNCARAVLQDCIRKRKMEQSNARKRSIDGCLDGDLLESKEFGWHFDSVVKPRDGAVSPSLR